MSAAAAQPATAGAAAPAKKGKMKLIIIVTIALLLLVIAGGAALMLMKKKAADSDDASAQTSEGHGDKPDLKHPPTFLPIDPFVVNLSDKDADRYAQVGITFEVSDAHFAEEMKAFMPAIRNGILMILSHKASKDLLDRSGKEQLAGEILRESSRTMGIDVEEPDPETATDKSADGDKAAADDEDAKPKPKKKKKKAPSEPNPIKHVHFSNFIVQ